jgi:AsmA protein
VFDKAVGTFRINKGVAEIVDASASAPDLSIGINGTVQIAERRLALKGVATQAPNDSKSAAELTQLPFEVIGSWDDPAIVPDTKSLIRRSGAAERLYRESGAQPVSAPEKVAE